MKFFCFEVGQKFQGQPFYSTLTLSTFRVPNPYFPKKFRVHPYRGDSYGGGWVYILQTSIFLSQSYLLQFNMKHAWTWIVTKPKIPVTALPCFPCNGHPVKLFCQNVLFSTFYCDYFYLLELLRAKLTFIWKSVFQFLYLVHQVTKVLVLYFLLDEWHHEDRVYRIAVQG